MSDSRTRSRKRDDPHSARKYYDKNLVREKTFELLDICLGRVGRDQGARVVWDCPACGKQDKYSVKKAERRGGCMVEGCRLAGYDDVFGMLAKVHDLDYYFDFRSVLVKSYELLGLTPSSKRITGKPSAPKHSGPRPIASAGVSRKSSSGSDKVDEKSKHRVDDVRLASQVYRRIMEICTLETRDRSYLKARGLSLSTIRKGRFGTMTRPRARKVKAVLQSEFDRTRLLRVPGFSEDEEDGRLKFTLSGDYLLIPYHDCEGESSTIEGRCVGEPPEGMGKYVSLRRAGNHLYVYPGHKVEDIQAVCEGAMGAIVAAECGLSVGAIQGCERFRVRLASENAEGGSHDPLPELKGVDFGGRTVPYIPDADDPPNLNVLRAAPKAARWLAEPQNGKAAICLLPRGVDLDEWLLSLNAEERKTRFAELLAGANPPEDGNTLPKTPPAERSPTEPESSDPKAEDAPEESSVARRKGKVSDGARRLRDEVYREMLETLSLKEDHADALARKGIWRATTRAGLFASLVSADVEKTISGLTGRFGARRLLTVPGFEPDGNEGACIPLVASGEFVLIPCFDTEGLLSGLEAMRFDPETGEIELEKTVPFAEGGDHLYVFAPYKAAQLQGFCEGILGALLAAQEDVVVGTIGDFRGYRISSGVHEESQGYSVLPELEGVDFDGRTVVYVPRTGGKLDDPNSRYHEVKKAAHWLIECQNGLPVVGSPKSSDAVEGKGGTSLGEWVLSLSEDERQGSLLELLGIEAVEREPQESTALSEPGARRDSSAPVSSGTAYTLLLLWAFVAVVLDALILRVETFSGYVSVGPTGEQVIYAGSLGDLRRFLDSQPFVFLYEVHGLAALILGLSVVNTLTIRTRRGKPASPQSRRSSKTPDKRGSHFGNGALRDVAFGVAAWPVAFVASRCVISTAQYLLSEATRLQLIPNYKVLDTDYSPYAFYVATVLAVFVLWRRVAIRSARRRMLRGKIRH